jgi:precorrin-6B methylase 2
MEMTLPTYSGPLIDAAIAIRNLAPVCGYDPVPHFPPSGPGDPLHVELADLFKKGYAGLKFAVARVLAPRRIVEVGVGTGCAARAFLAACPQAKYTGFDNDAWRPNLMNEARAILAGFDATILVADSRALTALPHCDLAHVDGGHDYETCYHDTSLALRAAEWVLVDDARDSVVAAAALKAAMDWRWGDLDWAMFEDSWTGSILIHTAKNARRPA